ncbi:hypothetical protein CHS0354_031447 [Potamilus streckersoni]|uniref:Transcobalamin-like C-terminal domain-containing protein n=1 Tax=Potamilus streckersoni TaxID=2493646 RepID=A0AAE0VVX2_9BIVA|nr:hypothetical protein CHS0354_031447 [Potamilus streckersoni]
MMGLAGEYDNVTSTYWSLLVNNQSASTGVTSLYPKDGDAIMLNFTQVFNNDLAPGPIPSSTHQSPIIG